MNAAPAVVAQTWLVINPPQSEILNITAMWLTGIQSG
jgi:hypothetical protein